MTSTLKLDVNQIATAFAKVGGIARKACDELGNAFYGIAREQYAIKVGRLPGSERTARLRKKRRARIMEWFGKEFLLIRNTPLDDG